MAETQVERLFTVNLSDAYRHKRTKRAKGAVSFLKSFLAQHLKTEPSKVKLSNALASLMLSRGMQKPPRSVTVKTLKSDDAFIVYLKDEKIEKEKPEEKKDVKNELDLCAKQKKILSYKRF